MPRRKKLPEEWTTEEAMRKLFPPNVARHAKRVAEGEPKPQVKTRKPRK